MDDVAVGADRRGDHRAPAGHVLHQFVAALAALPGLVGQRHDPDVEALHVGDLVRSVPTPLDAREGPRLRAGLDPDERDLDAAGVGEPRQRPGDGVQIGRGGWRADPADPRRPADGRRSRLIDIRVHHARDLDDVPGSSRSRVSGEIGVAGDHRRGPAHHAIDLAAQRAADDAPRVEIVAVEHGVVVLGDVRDTRRGEQPFGDARQPGKQLVLDPHEIVAAGLEQPSDPAHVGSQQGRAGIAAPRVTRRQ